MATVLSEECHFLRTQLRMATDDEEECGPVGMCICVLFWWACFGSMIALIVEGQKAIDTSSEYGTSSTKETCYVLDIVDQIGCTKYGDKVFEYTAIAYDKCGNLTLYSEYDDCGKTSYDIDSEQTCYVLDCDKQKFSFNTSTTVNTSGNVMLWWIIFGIITLGFALCATYAAYKMCEEANNPKPKKSYGDYGGYKRPYGH